jgi:hypothetical protein
MVCQLAGKMAPCSISAIVPVSHLRVAVQSAYFAIPKILMDPPDSITVLDILLLNDTKVGRSIFDNIYIDDTGCKSIVTDRVAVLFFYTYALDERLPSRAVYLQYISNKSLAGDSVFLQP